MLAAQVFVWAFVIYALLGCVFAVAFVARGVQRVDSLARESTMGFRLIIFPGAAALWPVLLSKWVRHTRHD